MQNTTMPTTSALESIDFELLNLVSGGCGGGGCRKRQCCSQQQMCAPMQQMNVMLPGAPAAAPAAQSAPMQDPMAGQMQGQMPAQMPTSSGGPYVQTSVSINGQPQA